MFDDQGAYHGGQGGMGGGVEGGGFGPAGPPPDGGGGGGSTPADTSTNPYATNQSPSQGQTLGASDVWNQQAFGGPTDAEQGVYGATLGTGEQAQRYGNQLVGSAFQQAGQAGNNQNLKNAMVAATNQYNGQDPSATPLMAQQQAYLGMVGPNGGYDAATKAAISNEGNAALNAQEAAARSQINNAQARTGSPIGAYGAIVDVNQNVGNQRSAQARQNQILFANEQERQKEAGAAGLGQNTGLVQNRENSAFQNYLASQGQMFGQGQQATAQANQFVNDQASRNLAAAQAAANQNAQQRAYQQAGGAGLTNLYNTSVGQQNQLYSMLASILGNRQADTSQLGEVASQFSL